MTISTISSGKLPTALFSAALIFVLSVTVACATEAKKAASKSPPLTQAYVWYNGDREQRVWLNPQVVAEFNPSPQGESVMKGAYARAVIVPTKTRQATVRFWQLGGAAGAAIPRLKANHPTGKYSAVLHDGPASSGRKRALPGNIIVYLNPQWSEAAVNDWLSSRKLVVVKKLEIGSNIYVIQTGPGLEALEAANALYKSGEVKAAFPDWWQEVTPR